MRTRKIFLAILLVILFFSFCSCNKQEKNEENEPILKKIRMDGFISMLNETKTEEEKNLVFALKAWQIMIDLNKEIKIDKNSRAYEKIVEMDVRHAILVLSATIKKQSINFTKTSICREDNEKAIEYLYKGFSVIADNEGNNDGDSTPEEEKEFARNISFYSIFIRVLKKFETGIN